MYQLFASLTIGLLFITSCAQTSSPTQGFLLDHSKLDSFVGEYELQGSDLDFEVESFKSRHVYSGTVSLSKHGDRLLLKMTFSTPQSNIENVENTPFTMYANLAVNDHYLSGDYTLGTDNLKGFGSVNILMSKGGKTGSGYTIFSSEYNEYDWGMTKFAITRI